MASLPIPDSDLGELYGLPMGEFIAARDKLAQRLKKEGHAARAAEVKKLVKPSTSAWVVNQLARTARREVDALLEAGEALREAHVDAMAGRGAAGIKLGMQARRDAVSTLVTTARGLLAEAGIPATASTLERVAETLNAIAAMPTPPALGQLSHDIVQEDSDFALLLGGGAPPPVTAARPLPRVMEEAPPPQVTNAPPKRPEAEDRAHAARVAKAIEHRDRAAESLRKYKETAKSASDAAKHAAIAVDRAKRAAVEATARARDAQEAMEQAKREAEARLREAEVKRITAEARQADADRAAQDQAHAESAGEAAKRALAEVEEGLARAEADLAAREAEISTVRKA